MYDTLAEKHEFLAFDESRKRSVLPTFVGAIMAEFVKQADNGYVKDHGFDFDTAVEKRLYVWTSIQNGWQKTLLWDLACSFRNMYKAF